jgi:hypothetical protein
MARDRMDHEGAYPRLFIVKTSGIPELVVHFRRLSRIQSLLRRPEPVIRLCGNPSTSRSEAPPVSVSTLYSRLPNILMQVCIQPVISFSGRSAQETQHSIKLGQAVHTRIHPKMTILKCKAQSGSAFLGLNVKKLSTIK